MDLVPSPSAKTCNKKEQMCSARHQNVQLNKICNLELYEFGETIRTTQCLACLRHSEKSDSLLRCGKCLMPSPEQSERIRTRIDIISDPLYVVRQGVRGERHGQEDWQYHQLESQRCHEELQEKGSHYHCEKMERRSFTSRNSTGTWMDSRVPYLFHYLNTVDISHEATRPERTRYHNRYVFRSEGNQISC